MPAASELAAASAAPQFSAKAGVSLVSRSRTASYLKATSQVPGSPSTQTLKDHEGDDIRRILRAVQHTSVALVEPFATGAPAEPAHLWVVRSDRPETSRRAARHTAFKPFLPREPQFRSAISVDHTYWPKRGRSSQGYTSVVSGFHWDRLRLGLRSVLTNFLPKAHSAPRLLRHITSKVRLGTAGTGCRTSADGRTTLQRTFSDAINRTRNKVGQKRRSL
jgi:hypothetical protein